MMRLFLALFISCGFMGLGHGQVAEHCRSGLTLETLVSDMVQQNISAEADFWGANQTRIHLLLANASPLALESLTHAQGELAGREVRNLVRDVEQLFDLPLPEGGGLLPRLRAKSANLVAAEQALNALILMEPWVDIPFSEALDPKIGIDRDEFYRLWAQARTYAGDPQALAYAARHNLIIPRAIRMPERFRPVSNSDIWSVDALLDAIFVGRVTWVEAENIVLGWMQAGLRIRAQGFAIQLKEALYDLRQNFVAGRPNFESTEPFSGYFTSWQRWEDLSARLLLILGQRDEVPQSFFHQTLALGILETEPNIAALDASLLFAAWQATGYQSVAAAGDVLSAQRAPGDVRRAQDIYAFLQVLVRGPDLGKDRLIDILREAETAPNARWLGGALLMQTFISLDMKEEALRAVEVAAKTEPGFTAPYSYVTPLIRIGEIDLARDVLSAFHQNACSRIALRSDRTYSWIDWMPLAAAVNWRIPVSRFDGI